MKLIVDMIPEMHERIVKIFDEALDVEVAERVAFLDKACGDDQSLRNEVQSLLDHAYESISIIDSPPIGDLVALPDLEGKTINQYRVLSRIGTGGMGIVYVAQDERLGRRVALKLLPPLLALDQLLIVRMEKEARAAAALNHPNIITIYDVGYSPHFIAMELIEGETLRQKMKMPMPVKDVIEIGIQITSGLVAAHEAGVLHRDIKPENIMFAEGGYVKILDFGIAKFNEAQISLPGLQPSADQTATTQTSAFAGTLSYMSPEQARHESLDARTDIFSLGILLFEMITGRRPFESETQAGVLDGILNKEAPLLRQFRPNVSSDLERIITKALKKNRDERYRSAKELLTDLLEFDRETAEGTDATQRANSMFRQYLSIYAVNKHALVPLSKLWSIYRYSNIEKGESGRELLRKSLRSGLLKSGILLVAAVVLALLPAAALSVDETWEETILRDGHTRAVRQAAFSPDGRLLVSVGEDNKVIVWDFLLRMPLKTLTDHTNTVMSVAFAPDGRWFATGSKDGKVIVWDAAKLERIIVLNNDPGFIVSAVAFSPDGRLLACKLHRPFETGQIMLWNTGKWEVVHDLKAQVGEYGNLIFASKGTRIVSSLGQSWDVASGKELKPAFRSDQNWIAISPDEAIMLLMGSGGQVGHLEVKHSQSIEFTDAHQDHGRAVAFSSDGRLAATGADDIVLWDPTTMSKLARFEYEAVVWNVTFSPDGRWLISTHGDGAILVWDVAERKLAAMLNGHSSPVRSVSYSPDGKVIASASEDHSVIFWDANTGRKNAVLLGGASRLNVVTFSPDGESIVTSGFNVKTSIWRRPNWENALSIQEGGTIYSARFSPDSRWVATSHGVYDRRDGHSVVNFQTAANLGNIYGIVFSPDGHWLVVASAYKFVAAFKTEGWQLSEKVDVPNGTFVTIDFSRDNKHFVTGDDEGMVRLWQVEPLRQEAVIGRHTSRIKSVAVSPDGNQVVSAGDDHTIRLWDIHSRRLVKEIGTHTHPVLSVSFSPDGKQIVSGEHDRSVRLYKRQCRLWGFSFDWWCDFRTNL